MTIKPTKNKVRKGKQPAASSTCRLKSLELFTAQKFNYECSATLNKLTSNIKPFLLYSIPSCANVDARKK